MEPPSLRWISTNRTDGLEVLQPEDDAATVLWGSDWRMPTRAEFEELISNCTADFAAVENGMAGVRLTSTVEGYEDASIFLPADGYAQDANLVDYGTMCDYWTATTVNFMAQFAFAGEFWLSGDYAGRDGIVTATYRYLGKLVRPVTAK